MNNISLIPLDKYNQAEKLWQKKTYSKKKIIKHTGNLGLVTGEKNNLIALEIIHPFDTKIKIPTNTPIIAKEIYNPKCVRQFKAAGYILFRLEDKDMPTNKINQNIKIHANESYIPFHKNKTQNNNFYLLNGDIRNTPTLPNEIKKLIPMVVYISATKRIITKDSSYWMLNTYKNNCTKTMITNWIITKKSKKNNGETRLQYLAQDGRVGYFDLNIHLLTNEEIITELGIKTGFLIDKRHIKELKYVLGSIDITKEIIK